MNDSFLPLGDDESLIRKMKLVAEMKKEGDFRGHELESKENLTEPIRPLEMHVRLYLDNKSSEGAFIMLLNFSFMNIIIPYLFSVTSGGTWPK